MTNFLELKAKLISFIKSNKRVLLKALFLLQIILLIPVTIGLTSLSITAWLNLIIIYAAIIFFKTILMTLTAIGKTIQD